MRMNSAEFMRIYRQSNRLPMFPYPGSQRVHGSNQSASLGHLELNGNPLQHGLRLDHPRLFALPDNPRVIREQLLADCLEFVVGHIVRP